MTEPKKKPDPKQPQGPREPAQGDKFLDRDFSHWQFLPPDKPAEKADKKEPQ